MSATQATFSLPSSSSSLLKVPNKGGRGQRKREEIGADWLVCERFARVFVASPLSRALDKTAMLRRLGVSVSLAVKIVCLRLS